MERQEPLKKGEALRKGRSRKLTDGQVWEIRKRRREEYVNLDELAMEYEVSCSTINAATYGTGVYEDV